MQPNENATDYVCIPVSLYGGVGYAGPKGLYEMQRKELCLKIIINVKEIST